MLRNVIATVLALCLGSSANAAGVITGTTPKAPAVVYRGGNGRIGGDRANQATAIPSLPYFDSGSTCGFENDYDWVCPYGGSTSPDVVYSYHPFVDESINVDLCGSSYDTKVYIWQDTINNTVACSDDADCGYSGYQSRLADIPLGSDHTYYIVVDGYGGACGGYEMIVSAAGAPGGPGACCGPDDSCTQVLQAQCLGVWHGSGTPCDPSPCPGGPAGFSWVGYQACAEGAQSASFFNGDNWYGYAVPGPSNMALFDASFDPQGNGMPLYVHFGDFCVDQFPCPSPTSTPAGSALVDQLWIKGGPWTFDMSSGSWYCAPPGSASGSCTTSEMRVAISQSTGDLTVKHGALSAYALYVGCEPYADGTLTITDGATVTTDIFYVAGGAPPATGRVVVSGPGSTLATGHGPKAIGGGSGTFLLEEGATCLMGGEFLVGRVGEGAMTIRSGATLTVREGEGIIGAAAPTASGHALVTGLGSTWTVPGGIHVGKDSGATGTLEVADRAVVTSLWGSVAWGDGTTGTADVGGVGTQWNVAQEMAVGGSGTGRLGVHDGASVSCAWGRVGTSGPGSGVLAVTDNGLFSASGTLEIGPEGSGTLVVAAGGRVVASTLIVGPYGHLEGDGIVEADVQNNQELSLGSAPGPLHLDGNYTQGPAGSLVVKVDGSRADREYGALEVTGQASLAGTLEVQLAEGFDPPAGLQCDFLVAGAVDGQFSQVTPADGSFNVTYLPDRVRITFLGTAGVQESGLQAAPLSIRVVGRHPVHGADGLAWACDVPGQAVLTVSLHDIGGREVARREATCSGPGTCTGAFSARETRELPTGVYFLRAVASGRRSTARVLIVH